MKAIISIFLVMAMTLLISISAWAEDTAPAPRTIDITKLTCKEVMAGNDNDRVATGAFFHGYMAGQKNNTVVDLNALSDIADKAKDYCLSNPTSTVMEAFTKSAK